MSRPSEGRKRTRFTQNMNACRATANSVHTSPYRGLNRRNHGLNEALPRFKRGAAAVNASDERGSPSFKTQTHYTLSLVCTVYCCGFKSHPRQLIFFVWKSDCLGCALLLCLVCLTQYCLLLFTVLHLSLNMYTCTGCSSGVL